MNYEFMLNSEVYYYHYHNIILSLLSLSCYNEIGIKIACSRRNKKRKVQVKYISEVKTKLKNHTRG